MCVLYEPGEPIGTAGYIILAVINVPWLAMSLVVAFLAWWRPYLDLDCAWCGRPFYSSDRAAIISTALCPECGQALSADDLQELARSP
jgi:hypothetical protein